MQERLTTRDGNHRCSAFIDGSHALFQREVSLENVRWILDLSAAGTSQIAAKEGLKHQNQGISLGSRKPLLQNIGSHCPHLRKGNTHVRSYSNVRKPQERERERV
jgi:hypothetical protein